MIRCILTHPRPHIDEIAAIFLLYVFGEEKYPGVREAIENRHFDFHRAEDFAMTPEEYEASGYLLLGIGGGKFDEHPVDGSERKDGECCATLVAKDLGVDQLPELERILRFVNNSDLKASANPFDISSIIKALHLQFPEDSFTAIDFGLSALCTKYEEQRQFHIKAKAEFEAKAQVEKIPIQGINGVNLRMVSIETDMEMVGKYIRSKHGGGADILVQKNSTGQVQIFVDSKLVPALIDLIRLAQRIRLLEQIRKSSGHITTDLDLLSAEGQVTGAEEWYFFPNGGILLNGSHTAPNTPPTKLSLGTIKSEIRKVVRTQKVSFR